jgi:hypothetical protein
MAKAYVHVDSFMSGPIIRYSYVTQSASAGGGNNDLPFDPTSTPTTIIAALKSNAASVANAADPSLNLVASDFQVTGL